MAVASRTPVTGTFTGVSVSNNYVTRAGFNLSLSGFDTATVILQRSFDDGSTWVSVRSFTADGEFRVDDPEAGVYYRLNCTSWTSGTITYRMSS